MRNDYDLVFVSQVFFTSSATCGAVEDIVAAVTNPETLIAIDGYHGFLARPIDLSKVAARAFYMAGGYKYAMSGEGACFMHCPPGYGLRPRDTGWFAEFGALAAAPGKTIGYPPGGARFIGATFDPVGLYRMSAVLAWLAGRGLGVEQIHAHATALMQRFLERVEPLRVPGLGRADLVTPFGDGADHGNFLAFRSEHAGRLAAALAGADIQSDQRGDRLRLGFGLALAIEDVDAAIGRMAEVFQRQPALTG